MQVFCAGIEVEKQDDTTFINYLRRLAKFGTALGAVCTAPYTLANGGLLDGYRLTIHWENYAGLVAAFPDLDVTPEVFEIDRNRLTCADGTAAIDMMLSVVARDCGYRRGLWLVEKAIKVALTRVAAEGVIIAAIRRSHHICCLAFLANAATDRGCFVTLASSGPHTKAGAPHGGTTSLLSPNPLAIGIPTSAHPMLDDFTASLATVSAVREAVGKNVELEHPWLLDKDGRSTCDPRVLEVAQHRGSMLLFGGLEAGHKGFGLALFVEALT